MALMELSKAGGHAQGDVRPAGAGLMQQVQDWAHLRPEGVIHTPSVAYFLQKGKQSCC